MTSIPAAASPDSPAPDAPITADGVLRPHPEEPGRADAFLPAPAVLIK